MRAPFTTGATNPGRPMNATQTRIAQRLTADIHARAAARGDVVTFECIPVGRAVSIECTGRSGGGQFAIGPRGRVTVNRHLSPTYWPTGR